MRTMLLLLVAISAGGCAQAQSHRRAVPTGFKAWATELKDFNRRDYPDAPDPVRDPFRSKIVHYPLSWVEWDGY